MAELDTYLLTEPASEHADRNTWKPLRFLNLYRLALSGLFIGIFNLEQQVRPLGQADPPPIHRGAGRRIAGHRVVGLES